MPTGRPRVPRGNALPRGDSTHAPLHTTGTGQARSPAAGAPRDCHPGLYSMSSHQANLAFTSRLGHVALWVPCCFRVPQRQAGEHVARTHHKSLLNPALDVSSLHCQVHSRHCEYQQNLSAGAALPTGLDAGELTRPNPAWLLRWEETDSQGAVATDSA